MSNQPEVDPKQAEELAEVDHLKAQLMNRDMDLIMLQKKMLDDKFKEVNENLTTFSKGIVEKYGLENPQQVDVATGKINRNPTLVDPNA